MATYEIYPLVVGMNETDQGIMTYQRGYGQRIFLPIYVFYIKGEGLNILVDAGLEEFIIPPSLPEDRGYEVLEFEEALAKVGITPEDVDIVIQTHLHNDHCENTYKCTNARVVVQKQEYDFAKDPHPLDHRYFPDLLDGWTPDLVYGDAEVVPGIKVVLTPGHTPGGQSVIVDTAAGKAVITGFCCNDKNFPASGPAVPPGVHTDALVAYESAQRMKDAGDILMPLHDLSLADKQKIPADK